VKKRPTQEYQHTGNVITKNSLVEKLNWGDAGGSSKAQAGGESDGRFHPVQTKVGKRSGGRNQESS